MNRAMVVGSLEAELLDIYGDPKLMEGINNYNEGIRDMIDPRLKVGWGWWALAGLGVVSGLAIAVKNRPAGAALAAVSLAGAAQLFVAEHRKGLCHDWSRAWRW